MEFKDRMKVARERSGMSQVELADAVGVSQATISRAESGVSGSCTSIVRIARVCGVSPDWLEEGIGDMGGRPIASASDQPSLRDHFAGLAMQMAAEAVSHEEDPLHWLVEDADVEPIPGDLLLVAKLAYSMADAMLKARGH